MAFELLTCISHAYSLTLIHTQYIHSDSTYNHGKLFVTSTPTLLIRHNAHVSILLSNMIKHSIL